MKVIIVDVFKGEIVEEKEIPTLTIVDKMYVKELGLTNLAYVYHAEHREQIERILNTVNAKKKEYEDLKGEMFYKVLPALRADKPL